MKSASSILISIMLLAVTGYIVYTNVLPGCVRGVDYRIGEIDPEFEIDPEQVKQIASQAASVWNQAVGEDALVYDPNSEFEIDFVYDDRQQSTQSRQQAELSLELNQGDLDDLISEFDDMQSEYKTARSRYLKKQERYSEDLKAYNQDVESVNQSGDTTRVDELESRQAELDKRYQDLESDRVALNKLVRQVNELNEKVNEEVKNYNQSVNSFNTSYGDTETFDQGVYNQKGINIYQYKNQSDLMALLVHEFGHALGLDHIDDPSGVMYYLQHDNQESNIVLTESDLLELHEACTLSSGTIPKLLTWMRT